MDEYRSLDKRVFDVDGIPCEHLIVLDDRPHCLLFKQYLLDLVSKDILKENKKEKQCVRCVWYEKARNKGIKR